MRFTAIAVFAAFLTLEVAILAAAGTGLGEFKPSDLWSSTLSVPLAVFAFFGVLRRHAWGWWCGVFYVALLLLLFPIEMALDPDFVHDHDLFAGSIAALGVWSMICSGVLALLDSSAVRASVTPPAPSRGFFRSLPSSQIFFLGSVLLLLSLALYRPSGWYALAVWLLLLAGRRVWRYRAHAA